MKQNTAIVVGLGFGDEGKGVTTDYLCSLLPNPLVIRFSGGHQAGHTVSIGNEKRHVFSSFGSGTLRGVPTYWSQYCTLYPIGLLKEYEALVSLDTQPKMYVDALALVTTPYDIAFNRATEIANQHGSCGIGYSATVERSTLTPNRFYAHEMLNEKIVRIRMAAIKTYYDRKIDQINNPVIRQEYDKIINDVFSLKYFIETIEDILQKITIVYEHEIVQQYDSIVFEGSQGILLDQDHGFFPNVTRAYTTSRNAMEIIKRNNLPLPTIYYITRAYQTRHGNGPMTNEDKQLTLQNTELETNITNRWQGKFRKAPLDIDLLNHALRSDATYAGNSKKALVITCIDQIVGSPIVTKNSEEIFISTLDDIVTDNHIDACVFDSVLLNNGGDAEHMQQLSLLVA